MNEKLKEEIKKWTSEVHGPYCKDTACAYFEYGAEFMYERCKPLIEALKSIYNQKYVKSDIPENFIKSNAISQAALAKFYGEEN